MATQKNSKSSKVSASKGKPSKVVAKKPVAKKPAPKAAAKGKKPVKAQVVSGKSKPAAKPAVASQAKKAAPAAKKPAAKLPPKPAAKKIAPVKASQVKSKPVSAKPAPKPIAKSVPPPKPVSKPIEKPVAKAVPVAKSSVPNSTSPGVKPAVKTTTPALPSTSIPKPVAVKIPEKSAPKLTIPVVQKELPKSVPAKPTLVAEKNEDKSIGSKSSDIAKPSVSSKPMAEKPKEQPQPKEFQRKSLKHNAAHTAKPFDTMSEKKENKTMGVATHEEPQKSRYNDKELEEFDQLIDLKLIVAREQLEFYLKQLEDMAENPDNKIKGLDDGLSTLESERVSSMASRQQKLIQHLENAKIRIKNKVYGICRETGKLISKERLRAVPHATLSIEAKQAQN